MAYPRRRTLHFLAAGIALCAGLACSENESREAPCAAPLAEDAGRVFPCDVDAVLEAKCRRCHNTDAVLDVCYPQGTCLRGPFPLVTYDDTRVDIGGGTIVHERMDDVVASGYMPFQTPDIQPPVQTLTEDEKRILLDWLAAGAPPGRCDCSPSP